MKKIFIDFEAISEGYPQDHPFIMAIGTSDNVLATYKYDASRYNHKLYDQIYLDIVSFASKHVDTSRTVELWGWGCSLERKIVSKMHGGVKLVVKDIQAHYRTGQIGQSKLNGLLGIDEVDKLKDVKEKLKDGVGEELFNRNRLSHNGRVSSIIGALRHGYLRSLRWIKKPPLTKNEISNAINRVAEYCKEDVATLIMIDKKLSKLKGNDLILSEVLGPWNKAKNLGNNLNRMANEVAKTNKEFADELYKDAEKYRSMTKAYDELVRKILRNE